MLTLWCSVGMIFAHVLAQQPQQQCTCAQLTDCTSCIVGGSVPSLPLHLLQQPQGILPTAVQVANSYNTAEIFFSITPDLSAVVPCNITCLWNKQKKLCADFSIAKLPSLQPIANFVTPYIYTLPVLQFDLFTRFAASRSCQDDLGKHSSIVNQPLLIPALKLMQAASWWAPSHSPHTRSPPTPPLPATALAPPTPSNPLLVPRPLIRSFANFSLSFFCRTVFLNTGIDAGDFCARTS